MQENVIKLCLLVAAAAATPCLAQSCLPTWTAVGGNITGGEVHALALHDDGAGPGLYAGGTLTLNGTTECNVARFDGVQWLPVGPALASPNPVFTPSVVFGLASHDSGGGAALYAAGVFKIGSSGFAARWNGTAWEPIGQALFTFDLFEIGRSLHVHEGWLYLGGNLHRLNGQQNAGIARWNGTSWGGVAGGLRGVGQLETVDAWSLLTFEEDLYVSGIFWGGLFPVVPAPGVARWDGSSWNSTGWNEPAGPVGLTPHDDGSGAALWGAGGPRLSKHSPPSAPQLIACSAFGASNSKVNTCASFDDGSGPALYFAGGFSWVYTPAGTTVPGRNLGRWGGGVCRPFPDGPDGAVNAMLPLDGKGGSLVVGGAFTTVAGLSMPRVARLEQCRSCWVDCNGDWALNLGDFGCFQTRFAQGDPYADCNTDGAINIADFGCFQTRFFFGCP